MNRTTTLKRLLPGLVLAAACVAVPTFVSAAPAPQSNFADRRGPDRNDNRGPDHGFDRHDNDHRSYDRGNDRRPDFDRDHRDNDTRINLDFRIGGEYRPAYEDRTVRVWVPAVYRTECEQVWVPDVYEDREVRFLDHGRWCTRVDHVLVAPAHYESRERQVLVCDGHYETHIERVRVTEREPGFGFHIGG